jgi:RNA polymerase sigma factor (sigma-70 family)
MQLGKIEKQIDPVNKSGTSTVSDHFRAMDDHQLWDLFCMGEEAAFITIYKKHFQSLIQLGFQFLDKKSDVEDFVQDLFIDLRVKRNRLSPLKGSIKVFLFVSLKNKIIDYQRKVKVREKNLSGFYDEFGMTMPLEEDLIKTQEYADKIKRLNLALLELTTRQREAIYYLYFEDLSYNEIASLMNLDNTKSARNIVYKAFSLLKKLLY